MRIVVLLCLSYGSLWVYESFRLGKVQWLWFVHTSADTDTSRFVDGWYDWLHSRHHLQSKMHVGTTIICHTRQVERGTGDVPRNLATKYRRRQYPELPLLFLPFPTRVCA